MRSVKLLHGASVLPSGTVPLGMLASSIINASALVPEKNYPKHAAVGLRRSRRRKMEQGAQIKLFSC